MTARAEFATQQLYEDPDLRGELTDDEAAPLLKWGELEVVRLDARHSDEADFEAAYETLRRLLKTINRYVGQLAYTTLDEQGAAMGKISEHARALGYDLPPDAPGALLTAQAVPDNLAVLSSLLQMIDSGDSGAPAEPASSENTEIVPADSDADNASPIPANPSDDANDDSQTDWWLL